MIDELEKFYKLYGRLNKYREMLPREQEKYIADKLFENYKTEYELLNKEKEIESKSKGFLIDNRRVDRIPKRKRRFIFWKRNNRAADLADDWTERETEDYFRLSYQELEKKYPAEFAEYNADDSPFLTEPDENPKEMKKQARLRALEESRRQKKREQERAATSPKSPKTGTQSGGSESSSKA